MSLPSIETQLRSYGRDLAEQDRAGLLLAPDALPPDRATPHRRNRMVLVAVMLVFVAGIAGLAFEANRSSDHPTSTDTPTTVSWQLSQGDLMVGSGTAEVVGHIRAADLNAVKHDANGTPVDPFYPEIGFPVYSNDTDEVLLGYATPHQGFIPLDEVERYKADPGAYPSTGGTPASDLTADQLPPGFEPLGSTG